MLHNVAMVHQIFLKIASIVVQEKSCESLTCEKKNCVKLSCETSRWQIPPPELLGLICFISFYCIWLLLLTSLAVRHSPWQQRRPVISGGCHSGGDAWSGSRGLWCHNGCLLAWHLELTMTMTMTMMFLFLISPKTTVLKKIKDSQILRIQMNK